MGRSVAGTCGGAAGNAVGGSAGLTAGVDTLATSRPLMFFKPAGTAPARSCDVLGGGGVAAAELPTPRDTGNWLLHCGHETNWPTISSRAVSSELQPGHLT